MALDKALFVTIASVAVILLFCRITSGFIWYLDVQDELVVLQAVVGMYPDGRDRNWCIMEGFEFQLQLVFHSNLKLELQLS